MSDDELGFEAGFTQAHCRHCGYSTGLNTAVWIMWLHLIRHPRVLVKLVWKDHAGSDSDD